MDRICPNCNTSFSLSAQGWNRLYCSTTCSRAYTGFKGSYKNVPNGTVGAIAELEVACDLMKKGYEVFRSLSQSCSCDLAVLKNERLTRVEVKTGYRNKNGRISYPEYKKHSRLKRLKFDIIAIYLHESNEIIYRPDLQG